MSTLLTTSPFISHLNHSPYRPPYNKNTCTPPTGVVEAKRGTSYGWLRRLAKELDVEYYLRNISSEDLSINDDENSVDNVDFSNLQQVSVSTGVTVM